MRSTRKENAFWHYVEGFLIKEDKEFTTIEGNSHTTAIFDKEKNLGMRLRKTLSSEEMKNLWVFGAVKKQVAKWLKNKRLELLPDMFASSKKNKGIYDAMPINQQFCGTDLNHCYWRMAYKLGYITTKLYLRLIDENAPPEQRDVNKLLRNKALACLRSKEKYTDWKGTTRIRIYYEGNGQMEQLYNDIRNRCYKIMHDIALEIGQDFIRYKIDCIYYKTEARPIVEKMLAEADMPFSTFDCVKLDARYYEEGYQDIKKM